MDRITSDTAVEDAPSIPSLVGKTRGFFTKGSPGLGQPATILDDWWMNVLQEEIITVLEAAGITPDPEATNQLLQAIIALATTYGGGGGGGGAGGYQYVVDTGTSGVIVVAPSTALTPTDGDGLIIKLAHDIPGATTINASGTGAKALKSAADAAMQGGEGRQNKFIRVRYSATATAWLLEGTSAGKMAAEEPTQSHHLATKQYVDDNPLGNERALMMDWGPYAPVAGTYRFMLKARHDGTIESLVHDCGTASATFIANVRINGSSVTGLSAVNVNNTTPATTNASAANDFVAGDEIDVVLSSISSSPAPTSAALQLNFTYTA